MGIQQNCVAIVFAATLALAGCPVAVQACKVKDVVSPADLVKDADRIYHVRAEGYFARPGETRPATSPEVRFSVLAVLKGTSQDQQLHYAGVLVERDDPNEQPVPYDMVRSAGRHGDCFAKQYRKGREYVLLVKSGTPYWSPLAPTNEQISGESDPWLAWVKAAATREPPAQ